ncbi:hypothetical protein O4J56_02340 [Nocardiopsis sp. RSe5-2]|uniref:PQQ-binding-like beta-propeller repeat protein n=1 Tax=Nocardiopsis endophytica TaxID=3018445 RepID=A0ABT4TYI7_9ACTN|nr:hypothetical protein [Nocardiopsis endophytica]
MVQPSERASVFGAAGQYSADNLKDVLAAVTAEEGREPDRFLVSSGNLIAVYPDHLSAYTLARGREQWSVDVPSGPSGVELTAPQEGQSDEDHQRLVMSYTQASLFRQERRYMVMDVESGELVSDQAFPSEAVRIVGTLGDSVAFIDGSASQVTVSALSEEREGWTSSMPSTCTLKDMPSDVWESASNTETMVLPYECGGNDGLIAFDENGGVQWTYQVDDLSDMKVRMVDQNDIARSESDPISTVVDEAGGVFLDIKQGESFTPSPWGSLGMERFDEVVDSPVHEDESDASIIVLGSRQEIDLRSTLESANRALENGCVEAGKFQDDLFVEIDGEERLALTADEVQREKLSPPTAYMDAVIKSLEASI